MTIVHADCSPLAGLPAASFSDPYPWICCCPCCHIVYVRALVAVSFLQPVLCCLLFGTELVAGRIAWDLPSAATGIFSAPFLVSFGLAFEAAAGVKSTGFGFLAISTLFAILSLLPARFIIDKCLGNR